MTSSQLSTVELKMAALSSGIASVLASVACENALLRVILRERGVLTDAEWMTQQKQFAALKGKVFEAEISAKIQEESQRALARMTGGPIQ